MMLSRAYICLPYANGEDVPWYAVQVEPLASNNICAISFPVKIRPSRGNEIGIALFVFDNTLHCASMVLDAEKMVAFRGWSASLHLSGVVVAVE